MQTDIPRSGIFPRSGMHRGWGRVLVNLGIVFKFLFIFKRKIKLPKCNAIYFGSVSKLTENYYFLNYNSLYRVRMAVDVNKSSFVCPETLTQN